MIVSTNTLRAAACIALCGLFIAIFAAAGDKIAPHEWLARMESAVQ